MQFAKRAIAMTSAYGFFALAGMGGINMAEAAVSVSGSVTNSAFSGNIQKATTLKDAQNLSASTCATVPGAGSSCNEFVSCSGGGYASIAWAMSPNRMAAACGFPTQAEADAAALAKCGSGCAQGDQLFDPALLATSSCGANGSPNSGCATPATTTPATPTTPNATDSANIPRVFNWAEAAYGQYFAPQGQSCQDGGGYRYRYYANTKSYMAFKDGRVYVLVPALGDKPIDVGTLNDLLVQAKAAGF